MSLANELLLQLFRTHGVEAVPQDDWITFPGRTIRASAAIVRELPQRTALTVQLDVRLEVGPRRTIIESFAGVGQTLEKASADAVVNFVATSFHVLLAAFFRPDDEQVTREEWTVGGRPALVTIGNAGIRGKPPVPAGQLVGWFGRLRAKLEEQQLRPGTHWASAYHGQMQGRSLACEARLDNVVWPEMQSELAAFAWPAAEDFYGVRLFLVLQVQKGGEVSPQTAVAWLADIVAGWGDFTEDDVYTALAEAGVPIALADRAYKFTQTAWGRELLAGLGISFAPTYLCLNGAGEVVESGLLADEPCFATAVGLARKYRGAPGFLRLAVMSADVNTVNNALHAGSKPENLVTAPACLFLEAPTAQGMENARKALAEHLAALRGKPGSP
jgi:hypothetical protein